MERTGRARAGLEVSGLRMVKRATRVVGCWIVLNPMLVLALTALLVRYVLPMAVTAFDEGAVGLLWAGSTLILRPFSLIATWVDPYFRAFPEVVDIVATGVLGLLPYVAVDALYRRLMRRRA